MTHEEDREAIARAMIDANLYMTLATADSSGRPWASPVYYAVARYREFFWISEPEATHSRNLSSRPDVTIVIFDSTAPINTGRGVYMTAAAKKLGGAELDRGIERFSRRLPGPRWRAVHPRGRAAARLPALIPRDGIRSLAA